MAATFGKTALHYRDSSRVVRDRYGLDSGNVTWQVARAVWQGNPSANTPALGDAHPFCNWMHAEKVTWDFVPGFVLFAAEYAGVNGSTTPVYELEMGASEEPIQTHPKFVSDIAGTPAVPANGAIFRDEEGNKTRDNMKGIFDRFRVLLDDGSPNPFGGVTGYLNPQMTWTKTWITASKPNDLAQVGKIDTPEGAPPSLGGSRNWLYVALTYEERGGGNCYKVKKAWRASGARGWNTTLYS